MISLKRFGAMQYCRAILLCLTTFGSCVAIAQETTIEQDRYGNPVFSEDGAEVTYTHSQLGEPLPLTAAELAGVSSPATGPQSAIEPSLRGADQIELVIPSTSIISTDLDLPVEPATEQVQHSSNLINLEHVWQHSIWGANLGESGITAVDLDGDGSTELVLGTTLARNFGENQNWHIAKYNADSGSYDIVHTSDDNPDWSTNRVYISVVSVYDGVAGIKILIGYDDGTLAVFDGATRRLLRKFNVSNSDILSITQGDGDNDGLEEIIVATESNTYLYNPLTFVLEDEIAIGGRGLLVGNVDTDPSLEMVFVEGPVIQYDGSTAIQQWDFSGFSPGTRLQLGDLNGDGREELIVARSWYYIDVLDAQNRTPLRQITTSTNISQLKVVDVTGDNLPEILYGDQQHGGVHAIDGVSLVELWELDNPSSGAPGIEVADVDDDGELEVIWGSGASTTGPDFLSIHDVATRAREFISADEGGPFRGLALGDTDGDGENEIVVLGQEAEAYGLNATRYDYAIPLHVFDSLSLSTEWGLSDNPVSGLYYPYSDVAIGNVNGVGASEIVTTHSYVYDLNIDLIDGVSKSLISTKRIDMEPANSIAMADFVGDERQEIVAASGNQLHIIDPATMTPVWSSIVLAGVSSSNHIEAIDVYDDGLPDMIASIGRILVIDGVTKIYRQSEEDDYLGFAVIGPQWSRKIVAGTESGLLVLLDPDTLERNVIGSVCESGVNSVRADDSAAFFGTFQFACEDSIGIWSIYEHQVLWRSPPLGSQVGVNNSLLALENNGEAMLVVGTGHGVQAFKGPDVSVRDMDDDGLLNQFDNCPQDPNPNQEDLDSDGIGDACNSAVDNDGDDWADALDNCPLVSNPGQEDLDNSGRGDACESLPPGC